MIEQYASIVDLLARVRARWRRLVLFQAVVRTALVATTVLAVVLLTARLTDRSPWALATLGLVGAIAILAAGVWGARPVREVPTDARLARFVEERKTGLEERLVSAVAVAGRDPAERPAFAASMMGDAARAAASIDPAEIVTSESLRRAGFQALAASLLFLAVAFVSRHAARQSFDAMSLALFPSRITLEVTPGNARVEAGSGLTVTARLVGNSAPVVARLLRAEATDRAEADREEWPDAEMQADSGGRFTLSLGALSRSFRYRVVAGGVASPTFDVAVVRAPRVARIDVEYTYPKAFGLAPRVEKDGGDIYAPAGTDVRLRVHTDRPVASGRLMLGGSQAVELTAENGSVFSGSLQVVEDSSYRIALADAEGLASRGETEYFIRALDDRPPEVHLVRPGTDRRVTRLEEVGVEAEATDDFGIASLELVYSVRGGGEKVVPLAIPPRATSVTGRRTLYLEDLDVRPGDFVSYYVRARDVPRGKPSSQARSDIFFLEIRAFEEEFTLAQSQAAMGGGASNPQVEDLIAAQKEVIVATWKLDRRSQAARGAKSDPDIRAVATAEDELRARVERTASGFRASAMRDPRARAGGPGGPGRGNAPPTRAMPEEDAMTSAATAMAKAVISLNALKTADAIPPEMDALDHLMKAQADVRKSEVQRQQAGNGGTANRNIQDMSSLFDKELARHQQTNYETPNSTEQREEQKASALDKIKELARRQDELLKKQQDLARQRDQMDAEAMKRALETLTRDQNDLRQRAEDLARQMSSQQNQASQQNQSSQNPSQQNQAGAPNQGQQPSQGTQSGSQQRPGQQGGSAASGESGRQMRDISEEMRGAAGDLRRQDAEQASARAERALDKLRDLERQLQNGTPDGRRRALGDLQLEARQLADAERQIAAESGRTQAGDAGQDARRRLAGDQDRLAERLRRVQEGLTQQATSGVPAGNDSAEARKLQQAAGEASREIDRQRLAERMDQSAQAMRSPSGQPDTQSQQAIARSLGQLAERLASAAATDDESRKLSGQLAQAQELQQRLDDLSRQLEQLGQRGASQEGKGQAAQQGQPSPTGAPGDNGKAGEGGRSGPGGSTTDAARLREDAMREMQQVRDLLDQLRRENQGEVPGGSGFTFEGQGMTLSDPGTEAFKQDFARWEELKKQATAALQAAETTLAMKLQQKESKDRLAAGADDRAPDAYREQVDSYFKALATKKKP